MTISENTFNTKLKPLVQITRGFFYLHSLILTLTIDNS